jgi:cytochrome c oxidase subunit 3
MSATTYAQDLSNNNANADDTPKVLRDRARRTLTYLLVFAIVMAFSGLLSAYLVTKGSVDFWVSIRLPKAFYWSTAFILLSSATMQLALMMARRGRSGLTAPLLVATLGLGIAFSVSQFKGWSQLRDLGNFFSFSKVLQNSGVYGEDYTIERRGVTLVEAGGSFYLPDDVERTKPLNDEMADQSNAASQYIYVLTALHLAHLAFGLLALLLMTVKTLMGRYPASDTIGLWSGSLYWHFLGGLWLIILSFFVLVH